MEEQTGTKFDGSPLFILNSKNCTFKKGTCLHYRNGMVLLRPRLNVLFLKMSTNVSACSTAASTF